MDNQPPLGANILLRPIICLATIDWHFLYQRHRHLMTRLAEQGHPVYFINATRVPGSAPKLIMECLWTCADFSLLAPKVVDNAIYFIYHPCFIFEIVPSPLKYIIYDCVDDFPEFELHESEALNRTDLVICSSKSLYEKYLSRHSNVMLLPNGVDAAHFNKRWIKPHPQLGEIKATGKPVIGFSGAMFQDWVDIDLIYYLAASNPDWFISIVGETYDWDVSDAPPNLLFLGRKSYDNLPKFLAAFDVGLIPFHDNQISRGTDPIKLYEYIAAGLPVVSRRLPFNDDLGPPLVYTYNTADECFSALNQALSETGDHVSAIGSVRRQYAVDNSWENRVDALINKLSELTWLEKINESPVPSPETASFITPDGSRHPMTIRRISQKAGGAQNPSKGNVKKTTRIKSAGNSIR